MSAPLLDARFFGYKLAARQMDILRRAYPEAARAACYTAATELTDAIRGNAPEDTGFLKQSAYVASTKKSAVFGFGAWYAVMVNGRNVNFKTGRKRFMKSTLDEKFPGVLQRLATLTSSYIRQGITVENVPRLYPPVPIAGDGWYKKRKGPERRARMIVSSKFGGFGFARAPRKRKPKASK